jgi:hypothetical protein
MNKKFFTGMAVLLIASLFFLGCGDSDPEEPGTPPKSVAETFADLFGGKAAVSGDTVTLTDNVSVTTAIEIPAGVTLSVPKDKTLTVGSGGSLTVTGTLAGAVDGTNANVAAKIVVTAAETVTAGTGVFYPTTGTAVVAGTYIWDAAAGGSGVAGWKQLEVVAAGTYTLRENGTDSTAVASGLTLDSALKNNATNTVTLKLGGTFNAQYLYYGDGKIATAAKIGKKWNIGDWGNGSDAVYKPLDGKYGPVYINGFFTASQAIANVAIESRNPALRFYTDDTTSNGTLNRTTTTGPLAQPATAYPYNYLPTDGSVPQRWVLSASVPANDTMGVLLYSGAASKTVTLKIETAASYASNAARTPYLNVIIDYSGVDFTAAGTETPVSGYSLKSTEGSSAVAAVSGLNLVSATKNSATDVITLTLGGAFLPSYLFTGDDTAADAAQAGENWEPGMWGNGSDATYNPPSGKFGPVYVNGFFATGGTFTNTAVQLKPYPGLLFYTGDTTAGRPSTALLTKPSPTMTNYISTDRSVTQRWKFWATGISAGDTFGVLLYSGASDKTVTLDIDTYDGGVDASKTADIQTVVINYNQVVFP